MNTTATTYIISAAQLRAAGYDIHHYHVDGRYEVADDARIRLTPVRDGIYWAETLGAAFLDTVHGAEEIAAPEAIGATIEVIPEPETPPRRMNLRRRLAGGSW
jgi:hypothetical protein